MARLSSYQKLKQQNAQLLSENQLLRDNLVHAESQLTYDTLTGIFNERNFYEHLERLVAELRRHRERELHIAYADINDFKTINDRFGHAEGDRALTHAAQLLKNNTREVDIVARLHGDEFAIALPGATKTGADALLHRIHAATALNPFCTGSQRVTLSFAIAIIPYDPSQTIAQNMDAADKAMFTQKTSRRQ